MLSLELVEPRVSKGTNNKLMICLREVSLFLKCYMFIARCNET